MIDQHSQTVHTFLPEVAKVAPAVAGATYSFFGFPLADVAAVVTICYTLFMGYLAFRDRVYRPWVADKGRE